MALFRDTFPSKADAAFNAPSQPTIAVFDHLPAAQFDHQGDDAGMGKVDAFYHATSFCDDIAIFSYRNGANR